VGKIAVQQKKSTNVIARPQTLRPTLRATFRCWLCGDRLKKTFATKEELKYHKENSEVHLKLLKARNENSGKVQQVRQQQSSIVLATRTQGPSATNSTLPKKVAAPLRHRTTIPAQPKLNAASLIPAAAPSARKQAAAAALGKHTPGWV